MKKTLLSIGFFLILMCNFLYAQEESYSHTMQSAENLLSNKKNTEALAKYEILFQKFPEATAVDYYNAACAASLCKENKKALLWLNKSIEMGYIDLAHLQKDADFENIKNTKKWNIAVKKCEQKFSKLANIFIELGKSEKAFDDLIPFEQNKKYGYMRYGSNAVVVEPIFETALFHNKLRSDYFEWDIKYGRLTYIMDKEKGLIRYQPPVQDYEDRIGYAMGESGHYNDFKPKNDKEGLGFVEMLGTITSFSKEYDEINQVTIFNNIYAIARKGDKYALINEAGEFLYNLDFNYSEIMLIDNNYWKNILCVKNFATQKWSVISVHDGKEVLNVLDEKPNILDEYMVIKKEGKMGVVDGYFRTRLPLNFDDVIYYRKPDYNRLPLLFYVELDGQKFYIDENRIEYKIK